MGELLVARRTRFAGRRHERVRRSDDRAAQPAPAPGRHPRGVAGVLRSLRVRRAGRGPRAHSRAAPGRPRRYYARRRPAGAGRPGATPSDTPVTHQARLVLAGAVTLRQLCTASVPAQGSIRLPAVRIVDAPRFRWRGLMLDSARHFQSPAFIMRYIDWMALHKLNVLGWHLTDDQGWRLEIRKYPRLTSVGAWRVPAGRAAARDIDPATGRVRLYGGFYTQEDVRRIVAHAAARNITIVPEIDIPGHATAAIVAYPQLGVTSHAPQAVPADWGIYPNLFNVEDSTFDFLEDVLAEVMELFPGEYVHVGGDEAVTEQWWAPDLPPTGKREAGAG